MVPVVAIAQEPTEPAPAPTPAPTPAPSPTPQAALPKPFVIPAAERDRKNPVPAVPEAIEAGRNLYSTQCAMCHGTRGDGRGDVSKSLGMKIPDLTNPAVQKKRTDGDWFYILTKGHGQMPGEGDRLHPQNKWEIILYMRTLAPPAKPKP
jgi:mono/diheme cytochrome c family protein